jgi:hypothetical protein
LNQTSQGIDNIADFNVNDDALDITDLIGNIGDTDDIQTLLNEKLDLQRNEDGSGKLSVLDSNNAPHQAVSFGSESNLNSSNEITVVFQDQEYKVNIDG